MNFIRKIFRISITLIFMSASAVQAQSNSGSAGENEMQKAMAEVKGENMHVSLVNLIANPEKYHRKTIQVVGYLNLEFEGNAVYLHQEDYKKDLTSNGFWVEFSETISRRSDLKNYSQHYVIVIGTFDMNDHGHMDLFGGTLKNIRRLDKWK